MSGADPTSEAPSSELIKELYARFGLAYYLSECLQREACLAIAWHTMPTVETATISRIEEIFARVFSLTLGEVTEKLRDVLPDGLHAELLDAVELRNFLAHRFWFERSHMMSVGARVEELIAELDDYGAMFSHLDAQLQEWSQPMVEARGIHGPILAEAIARARSGTPGDPILHPKAVRALDRTLSREQLLVRVWDPPPEQRGSIVFELDDGSLWELSDVGLARSALPAPGADWIQNSAVEPLLPARIRLRPPSSAPWTYEFPLARGGVLWVQPGRRPRSYRWGVRTGAAGAAGQDGRGAR